MSELNGPILVVGAGLLGTSLGMAARRAGIEVFLADPNREHIRTASGLGAGREHHGESAQLVVVAVPPDHLGSAIGQALTTTTAVVTDVGSIKSQPLAELSELSPEMLARYVGSHPMAGSERSGPLAATATLFEGRPWALTPHPGTDPAATGLVRALITLCGGVPLELSPEDHDAAVARTSHLPHLMASLVAGRLTSAPEGHLALSGQGVRDVTRIAAGDPALWQQIITANRTAVLALLDEVVGRLGDLRDAVADPSREALGLLLAEGVAGTKRIPGKHGGPAGPMQSIFVAVPDHPGELARLFADAGEIGVNVEDVHIDHDPGRPGGQVELLVDATRAAHLATSLTARDWDVRE